MYLVVVAMAIDWRGGIGARDGMQGHDDLVSGTKKTVRGEAWIWRKRPQGTEFEREMFGCVVRCEFGMNWAAASGRGESGRRLRLKSGWRS